VSVKTGARQSGHPPACPPFAALVSHVTMHPLHTKWVHGNILGSARSSWHMGHSRSLKVELVAMVTCIIKKKHNCHCQCMQVKAKCYQPVAQWLARPTPMQKVRGLRPVRDKDFRVRMRRPKYLGLVTLTSFA
jgi:hypothetical protein